MALAASLLRLVGGVVMTELVLPTDLTFDEAQESVELTKRDLASAGDQIVRQINGRAWLAFGLASWDEMREKVYGGIAVMVPRANQPELMSRLRQEGLSQVQVAKTMGVSESTVSRNLQMQDTDQPATRTDSLGRERPTTYASKPDRAAELINEFPELDHYADCPDDAIRIGEALRGYDEPELSMRRKNLAKSIAAEQRQSDEPETKTGPDYHQLADDMFRAANAASKAIAASGGPGTFEQALDDADPLTVENWENEFASLAMLCRQVASVCRPQLRRVK